MVVQKNIYYVLGFVYMDKYICPKFGFHLQ
jgi:hypothetical protein